MLKDNQVFSGFSVDDLAKAKKFYQDILGVRVSQDNMGLHLKLAGGNTVFIYQKDDHAPATFTVLNFIVENIDQAVQELQNKGVEFEHYDDLGGGAIPDDKGILRGLSADMGPDIAWFKDPAGNVLSVLQEK